MDASFPFVSYRYHFDNSINPRYTPSLKKLEINRDSDHKTFRGATNPAATIVQ